MCLTFKKRRWGNCWSINSCFGSQKNNTRIGNAVPEPVDGLMDVIEPMFSALITEPSTAPLTPPLESLVHVTTPSSPEVPFAQLLTSSLELTRRDSSGMNQKFSPSHYEFRSNKVCPGSPGGGNLISPSSVVSNSGTSSPYPARKWGSRFGSGSIKPVGHGSGALTPKGPGMVSVNLTLNNTAWPMQNQISEVESLANSDNGSEVIVEDHRVSFELTGEDVACRLASKLNRSHDRMKNNDRIETDETRNSFQKSESIERVSEDREREQQRIHNLSFSSIGSSKKFKSHNTKEENI
ncbi:hypothetical protein N665_0049s0024 [Sinapis alba]|nr:hypothetical protein N665_0049s0024 [Sinapis alba]